uniref:Uncharacterized protein n=1 Tax=Rhizophora mucronata TaxID=61149 RepID=A0A2P2IJV8_RHIMU
MSDEYFCQEMYLLQQESNGSQQMESSCYHIIILLGLSVSLCFGYSS